MDRGQKHIENRVTETERRLMDRGQREQSDREETWIEDRENRETEKRLMERGHRDRENRATERDREETYG